VTTAAPGWGLLPQAPIAGRAGHTAVWTGREMVIWGGASDFEADPLTNGAAFDPATRTWRKVPAAPLSPRFDAQAVWTGREMIVFGGSSVDGNILGDGAAWDPATNRWRALPGSPIGARDGAVVAWAGDRLVVWGGSTVLPDNAPDGAETEMKNDGAAYVPATNSWASVAAAPIPARSGADSAWTGTRLVVSGGYHEGDDDDRTDGAALDPVSGSWSPIATRPTPGSCGGGSACAGIWTGKVALFPVSGLSYDPAADRWSAMAPAPIPDGPAPGEPAVWTGRRFMTWGISGADADDASGDNAAAAGGEQGAPPTHGATYDPAANRWQPFVPGPLSSRVEHTAVWTGQDLLIWGGTSGETPLADGAAYHPE
jgi:N-acetylneuraminic acid mutarotase